MHRKGKQLLHRLASCKSRLTSLPSPICYKSFSLQHCIQEMTPNHLPFLHCYFKSEHFPLDLLHASQYCFEIQDNDLTSWETIVACAQNHYSQQDYYGFVQSMFSMPRFEGEENELVRVDFNFEYSALAAVDLKKAICRANVSYFCV